MTDDEFDEKLGITADAMMNSLAAKAVQKACKEVLMKVLRKHNLRKDSWHRTTSVFSMGELVHNKMHRLKELYPKIALGGSEVLKEVNDELDDIIAYSAFQKYVLNVDKLSNPYTTPESDTV